MQTYEQLMQAYESTANQYLQSKLGTKKHSAIGKKLDKACEALEQFRTDYPEQVPVSNGILNLN
jgi:hypothetical protein